MKYQEPMCGKEELKDNETTTMQDNDGTLHFRTTISTQISVNTTNRTNNKNPIFRRRLSGNDFIFSERKILLSTPLCIVNSRDIDSDPSSDELGNCAENNISRLDVFNSLSKDLSRSTLTNTLSDENKLSEGAKEHGYYSICCSALSALRESKIFSTPGIDFSPQSSIETFDLDHACRREIGLK